MEKKLSNSITGTEWVRGFNNPLSLFADAQEMARLTYLNFFISPKDSHDFGHNAPTVLLIPGWGCNKGAMSLLGDCLKNVMNVVYADNFPAMNMGSIESAAWLLEPTIRKAHTSEKNGDLILVGYSNGGIIALFALHRATNLEVRKVMTMGTPHKWTPRAELPALLSPSCREINKKGGYLQGIDLSKKISGNIVALVATDDKLVPSGNQIPSNSLVGSGRTKIIPMKVGHFGFIMWDEVKQTAQTIIENTAH